MTGPYFTAFTSLLLNIDPLQCFHSYGPNSCQLDVYCTSFLLPMMHSLSNGSETLVFRWTRVSLYGSQQSYQKAFTSAHMYQTTRKKKSKSMTKNSSVVPVGASPAVCVIWLKQANLSCLITRDERQSCYLLLPITV